MKEKKYSALLFVLAIIILFISILPLSRSDFIKTHDNNLYPILQYEFDQGIREGHLLPRWSADFWLGLGSPMFNFIQPLFFYLAEIFYLFGLGFITAIKIVIILGFILGFVSMYLLAKEIWGRQGGFISAALFTFFPYRLALVYVRGAFAEFLALSLIPLVLYLFLKLIQTKKRIYFLFCSLLIALLFLCHNITALFFIPLLIVYLLFIFWPKIKEVIWLTFLTLIFGLTMAAFFTLPAFFEKKYLEMGGLIEGNYDFHIYFLKLIDLFPPKWDSFNFYQIGAMGVILILLIVMALINREKLFDSFEKKNLIFFTLVIIISSVLTLSSSAIFWEKVPLVNLIQFPWRILSFQVLGLAILGGLFLKQGILKLTYLKKISKKIIVIIITIIIVSTNFMFTRPLAYLPVEEDHLYNPFDQSFKDAVVFKDIELTEEGIEKANAILKNFPVEFIYLFSTIPLIIPRGIALKEFVEETTNTVIRIAVTDNEKNFNEIYPKINILEGDVAWQENKKDSYATDFTITASEESQILINQFWFPGWRAYLDGEKIEINHDNNIQIMTFKIPQGEHLLELRFKNTLIRTISVIISILAWVLWLYLLFNFFRKKRSPQQ